jgi:hypothetical protein
MTRVGKTAYEIKGNLSNPERKAEDLLPVVG